MKLNHEKLQRLVHEIFLNAGCEDTEAESVSEHLVEANLVGHDSHGVIRTPIYVTWMREEKVFANRKINIVSDSGALVVLDGQMGVGQSVGQQTLKLAIDKCREHGVSVTALRNSGHLGRIGHWAEMAIDAGFVALHFVNTTGLGMHVVPVGGIDSRLSINPITVGIPIEGRSPFVLDIAAAMTAEGKLKVARNKGVPVPDGWIIDAEGQPTNDPNDFYGPPFGAILPFGSHKGYGLGLVAELLAGALTGGGCSREGETRLVQGMLSILIDPVRLQSQDAVFGEILRYVDFVRTSRPVSPDGEVLIPGDVEARNRQQRMSEGIELDDKTWSQIEKTARGVSVSDELIQQTVQVIE
jgi:uncharacterized oxidoreductase